MMRTAFLCLIVAVSCRTAAAESIYSYDAGPESGPDQFFGDVQSQPFASEMVFRWQASAGNYFSLDSHGETLSLGAALGLHPSNGRPFDPAGITIRELRVTLSDVTGSVDIPTPVIVANVPMDASATVPDPGANPQMTVGNDGINDFGYYAYLQMSGTGTFSSISFSLAFDGAGTGQLGVPFDSEDFTTATPSPPNFSALGTESTGYLIVVPEPSSFLLVVSGVGLPLLWRKRKPAA